MCVKKTTILLLCEIVRIVYQQEEIANNPNEPYYCVPESVV